MLKKEKCKGHLTKIWDQQRERENEGERDNRQTDRQKDRENDNEFVCTYMYILYDLL